MRLIAIKEVKYAGILRKVGDEFEAAEKDAQMLTGFRKARQKYETREQKAEQIEQDSETSRRGRYKRRDMVPEQP